MDTTDGKLLVRLKTKLAGSFALPSRTLESKNFKKLLRGVDVVLRIQLFLLGQRH